MKSILPKKKKKKDKECSSSSALGQLMRGGSEKGVEMESLKPLPIPAHGRLREVVSFLEADFDEGKRRAYVTIISSGLGNARDKNYYSPEVLASSVKLFEGTDCYLNHMTPEDEEQRPERDVKDKCGMFSEVVFDPAKKALKGYLNFSENHAGNEAMGIAKSAIKFSQLKPGKVWAGLSIDASGPTEEVEIDGVEVNQVKAFESVKSADVVTSPARGGQFERMVESIQKEIKMVTVKIDSKKMEEADKAFKSLKDKMKDKTEEMEALSSYHQALKSAYAEDEDEGEGEDGGEGQKVVIQHKDAPAGDGNRKSDGDNSDGDTSEPDFDDEDEEEARKMKAAEAKKEDEDEKESVKDFLKSNLREVQDVRRIVNEELSSKFSEAIKENDFKSLREQNTKLRKEASNALAYARILEQKASAELKLEKAGLGYINPKRLWAMTEAEQDMFIAEEVSRFKEVEKKFSDRIEGVGGQMPISEATGTNLLKEFKLEK